MAYVCKTTGKVVERCECCEVMEVVAEVVIRLREVREEVPEISAWEDEGGLVPCD